MFVFILEVLASEGPRSKGSGSFFDLPKKRSQRAPKKHRMPSKAPAPPKAAAPVTPSPPHISMAVSQAILRSLTDRVTPPSPITLSQVEDVLATSKMVQALHSRTPPPSLAPTVTSPTSALATPAREMRLTPPQLWYVKNPMPAELESFPAWVSATLENGVPIKRLRIIVDSTKDNQQKWAARKSSLQNAEAIYQLGLSLDPSDNL